MMKQKLLLEKTATRLLLPAFVLGIAALTPVTAWGEDSLPLPVFQEEEGILPPIFHEEEELPFDFEEEGEGWQDWEEDWNASWNGSGEEEPGPVWEFWEEEDQEEAFEWGPQEDPEEGPAFPEEEPPESSPRHPAPSSSAAPSSKPKSPSKSGSTQKTRKQETVEAPKEETPMADLPGILPRRVTEKDLPQRTTSLWRRASSPQIMGLLFAALALVILGLRILRSREEPVRRQGEDEFDC